MSKWIKVLIIVAIATLATVGVVYAYDTLWSGKAQITIETPDSQSQGELEITSIEAGSNGIWDEATGIWTVSLGRAEMAGLLFTFYNGGSDACQIVTYIDGEQTDYKQIAPGVFFHGIDYPLAAGAEVTRVFIIEATLDAAPGTLPEIQLELRQE